MASLRFSKKCLTEYEKHATLTNILNIRVAAWLELAGDLQEPVLERLTVGVIPPNGENRGIECA